MTRSWSIHLRRMGPPSAAGHEPAAQTPPPVRQPSAPPRAPAPSQPTPRRPPQPARAPAEAAASSHPNRNLFIAWPAKDHFPLELFYVGPNGRILLMAGFSSNIRIFHKLKREDFVLSMSIGDDGEVEFGTSRSLIDLFDLDRARIVFLCNTKEQVDIAQRLGLRAEWFNHNAMLDERVYRILPRPKEYDAVSNARLIRWKRVRLARKVENLALITGHRLEEGEYDDARDIPHAYLAPGFLPAEAVVDVLCRSHVGLSLSASEGACLSSSEYLLCGLPVVSTPSTGGRDVWYDGDNSIICEPTEEGVASAVSTLVERLRRGDLRPEEIREQHIRKGESHRRVLLAAMGRMFAEMGVSLDVEAYFRDRFRDKLGLQYTASYDSVLRTL